MRRVVGLRLPTIAGTQGDQLPSSNRWIALHRDEGLARVGALGILGREEVGNQHDEVEQDQEAGARHGEVMAAEAPPHQLPVGGDGDPVLGFLAGR